MGSETWMTIGEIARRAGLTAKALRHYDRLGLLSPESVDQRTGYRHYSASQVEDAVFVRRLREIDMPLDEIARLIRLRSSPIELHTALATHRRRVEARLTRLQRVLHQLDHLANEGMSSMDEPRDHDLETTWAKELFNRVWSLLEMENRSANDDAEMIHAAHASCFHWNRVGQPVNAIRGEWQCSRVYSTLGRSEPALFHAQRCLSICREHGIGDFDLAFAYEALARANGVAGCASESTLWAELARSACEDVKDDDDRELVLTDLETLPEPAPG